MARQRSGALSCHVDIVVVECVRCAGHRRRRRLHCLCDGGSVRRRRRRRRNRSHRRCSGQCGALLRQLVVDVIDQRLRPTSTRSTTERTNDDPIAHVAALQLIRHERGDERGDLARHGVALGLARRSRCRLRRARRRRVRRQRLPMRRRRVAERVAQLLAATDFRSSANARASKRACAPVGALRCRKRRDAEARAFGIARRRRRISVGRLDPVAACQKKSTPASSWCDDANLAVLERSALQRAKRRVRIADKRLRTRGSNDDSDDDAGCALTHVANFGECRNVRLLRLRHCVKARAAVALGR